MGLIDESRARVHQSFMDLIKGLKALLDDLLDRHEAPCGPGDRLPNRFGIRHIMRVRLDTRA